MKYLIDTNVLINIIEDYLPKDIHSIINDYDNLIYVSSESIKEFIHLVQIGKINMNKHTRTLDVFDLIGNKLGFSIKYIAKEHLHTFISLERVEGHNDPSDRLIIAQAITENIPLISSDTKFPKYRKQGLTLIQNR
jgi:PIN domain nuclease of toxin-antitoxin system